jgi:hypothetical protein
MRRYLAVVILVVAVWSSPALAQTAYSTEAEPERPPGYVGRSLGGQPNPTATSPDFVPILDRWRLGLRYFIMFVV